MCYSRAVFVFRSFTESEVDRFALFIMGGVNSKNNKGTPHIWKYVCNPTFPSVHRMLVILGRMCTGDHVYRKVHLEQGWIWEGHCRLMSPP